MRFIPSSKAMDSCEEKQIKVGSRKPWTQMGSSCWVQESYSGGFEWEPTRTRNHSTDETLRRRETLFMIAGKDGKGCAFWVASKKRLE